MKFVTHPFKIIIACLLLGVFIFSPAPTTVHAKLDTKVSDIVDLSGITKDPTGSSIVKSQYATREEFAQMLVQASLYAGDIKSSKSAKLFQDVKSGSSKASYIQLAVAKGYMSGYLGGKFKPKQAVTLKEAVYGTLAVLGYTNNDFMSQLSGSRYEKFKEIGLSKNISNDETDNLTLEDCENLFYNLLNSKTKTGEIYATALGYTLDSDGKVDYQAILKKKTKGPLLVTDGWKKQLKGKATSYQAYYANKKMSINSISNYNIIYIADQANKIWVYDKKVYGNLDNITYDSGKPTVLTISGTNYTVEKPEDLKGVIDAAGIQKDMMVILLLGRDDKVSYILPMQYRLAGGDWQQYIRFNSSEGIIYRNGEIISPAEVKSTDVVYYTNELKTVWVYGKTAYGVITSISPTTAVPDSVTIAGVNYTLNGKPVYSNTTDPERLRDITENEWGKRLRENGVQEGDNVAVYFGFDGKIAEICKVSTMSVTISGYVLEVNNKVVKDSNKEEGVRRMISIIETGGTILEFECSDSAIEKGSLVEVTFDLNKPVVKKIEAYSSNNISDLTQRSFAEDARILMVKDGNYTKLKVAEIKGITWGTGNALYCRLNSEGDISDLILTNITSSFYQYGLLKNVVFSDYERGIYSTQLILDMGKEITISPNGVLGDLNPGPKAVRFENNTLKEMKSLVPVRLQYINGKQASSGSMVYRITDDVLVYYYKNGEYFTGKFEDLPTSGNASVTGYIDNSQGPIHVIVVTK